MNNLRAAWEQIPGGLKQISVGRRDQVWGVNNWMEIYRYNLSSKSWNRIQGGLTQVSVAGDGAVMGVNSAGVVWRYLGGNQWESLKGFVLDQVSIGRDGATWGLEKGNIYRIEGRQRIQVQGGLKQISVGSADHVWGVNSGDQIFRFLPATNSWEQMPGLLSHVSVSANGDVWGVNKGGEIFTYIDDTVGWQALSGPRLSQLSVGDDGTVWGVQASDQSIFRLGREELTFKAEIPYQVHLSLTKAEYEIEAARWERRGYRPTHISGFAFKGESLYHVIWEKKEGLPFVAAVGMTSSEQQAWFDQNLANQYSSVFVDGHTLNGHFIYSGVMAIGALPAYQRSGYRFDDFQNWNRQYSSQGFQISSLSAYDLNGTDYYAAVWTPKNGEDELDFQVRASQESIEPLFSANDPQNEFQQLGSYMWNGADHFAGVWRKVNENVHFRRELNLTIKEFKQLNDELGHEGFRPETINGYEVNGTQRISATWSRHFQAKLFAEENYQGRTKLVYGNIDNLTDATWRSIKLSHRTGLYLFAGTNQTGLSQPIYADIPNIKESRLAQDRLGSIQVLPNPQRTYRDGWGVQIADGRYLRSIVENCVTYNLSRQNMFTLTDSNEVGWRNDRDNSGSGWTLKTIASNSVLQPKNDSSNELIFAPFRSGATQVDSFKLTQEGRRHFSLSFIQNGVEKWVQLLPRKQLIGVETNDQLAVLDFLPGMSIERWTTIGGSGVVKGVAVTSQGKIIGVNGGNGLSVRPHIYASWQPVPNSGSVKNITVMPDGTIVGAGTDHQFYTRKSLTSGWELGFASGRNVAALAAAPDGRLFAAGLDGRIYLRDTLNSAWQPYRAQIPNARAVAITQDPSQTVLALGIDQKIYYEADPGTFKQVEANIPGLTDIAGMLDSFDLGLSTNRETRAVFRLAVKVAENESAIDVLQTGEVALYENKNYWGKTWVVDRKFEDFGQIDGLSNQVSSLRIGGHTALTIYGENGSSPAENQELLRSVATMAETVVPDNQLAGVNPEVLVTPAEIGLSYHASLSQDCRMVPGDGESQIEHYDAYRMTMRFPSTVEYVDVWGTGPLTIEVGNDRFDIDAIKAKRLNTNELGRIVITTNADGLATSGLVLRTNTMKGDERVAIFPDQTVHERLSSLKENEMWEEQDAEGNHLLNRAQVPDQGSANHIQSAVMQVMKSVNYRRNSLSIGESNSRFVNANTMDFPQWQLNLTDTGHHFGPIDDNELANLSTLPNQQATRNIGQSIFDFFKEVKADGHKLERFVIKTGAAVKNELGEIGNQVETTIHYVENGVKKAIPFVINTAEKSAELVHLMFHGVGVTVERAVKWLRFIFDWGDILNTQKTLVKDVNDKLDYVINSIPKAEDAVKNFVRQLKETVDVKADEMKVFIDTHIGDSPPTPKPPNDEKQKQIQVAHEKIDWLLSKTVDHHHNTNQSWKEGTIGVSLVGEVEKLLLDIESNFIHDKQLKKAFSDIAARFQEPFGSPFELIARFLDVLIDVLEILFDAALNVIEAVIENFLEVAEKLLKEFKAEINKPWAIPFVSELFKEITRGEEELSMLNFVCLLNGIPTTILSKLITGKSPFPAFDKTTNQATRNTAEDQIEIGLNIAGGFYTIISGLLAGVLDLQPVEVMDWDTPNLSLAERQKTFGAGHTIRGKSNAASWLKIENDVSNSGNEWISLIVDIAGWAVSWPVGYGTDEESTFETTIPFATWWLDLGFLIIDALFLIKGHRIRRSEQLGRGIDITKGGLMGGLAIWDAVRQSEILPKDSDQSVAKLEIAVSTIINILGVAPDIFAFLRAPSMMIRTEGGSLLALSGLDVSTAMISAIADFMEAGEGG